MGDFWATITTAYWKKFYWQLAQTKEPSGDPPIDEYLSKNDLEAKAAKISLIEGISVFLSLCFYFFEINLNLI